MSYLIEDKENNTYYCGANPFNNIPRWYTEEWAVKFNCQSQARRVAIQLGLSYDSVIEMVDSLMNKVYIEVTRPKSLSDVKCKLYYMSSNSLDPLGEGYSEITNEEALEIAYKVYREFGK